MSFLYMKKIVRLRKNKNLKVNETFLFRLDLVWIWKIFGI